MNMLPDTNHCVVIAHKTISGIKRMKNRLFTGILLFAFAAPAFAADDAGTVYGILDVGSVTYGNTIPGTDWPQPGAYRLSAGYQVMPMLALEAGYLTIGDSGFDAGGGDTMVLKASSLQAAAVAAYPVVGALNAIGKIGLAMNSNRLVGTGTLAALDSNNSSFGLSYGIGAQYDIGQQLGVRALYESFGDTKVTSNLNNNSWNFSLTRISLGGIYRF